MTRQRLASQYANATAGNVRLICFDFKTHRRDYPLVALIKDGDMETLSEYSVDGKSIIQRSEYDLFMKTVVKLEGYVNVFDFAGKPAVFSQVYATEQKAKEIGEKNSRYYCGNCKNCDGGIGDDSKDEESF